MPYQNCSCASDCYGGLERDSFREAHLVQGVREAGHQLGVHELGLTALELRLLLDSELGGLHAEAIQLVVAGLQVRRTTGRLLQGRASVGAPSALDLVVSKGLDVIVAHSVGSLHVTARRADSVFVACQWPRGMPISPARPQNT